MFDASMVTCMTGWFEIEIISLAILNNFLTAIFMYFIIVLVWNVYCNYCYYCLMWITTLQLSQFETMYMYCNFVIHNWTGPMLHVQQYG